MLTESLQHVFVWLSETGGLGQLTAKKKNQQQQTSITRPRLCRGVIRHFQYFLASDLLFF